MSYFLFISVKALPRSVKIQSYNDTMKDKLTDIEKRVRQADIYTLYRQILLTSIQ